VHPELKDPTEDL
jgi:hypothetical protein